MISMSLFGVLTHIKGCDSNFDFELKCPNFKSRYTWNKLPCIKQIMYKDK